MLWESSRLLIESTQKTLPVLAVSFGRDTKSRWSRLPGVYTVYLVSMLSTWCLCRLPGVYLVSMPSTWCLPGVYAVYLVSTWCLCRLPGVYLVSMPGELIYPTQGDGENLLWIHTANIWYMSTKIHGGGALQ